MSALLPAGFASLEPYARDWAGGDAAARAVIRDNAGFGEMEAFHAAVQPLLDAALAYLDAKPLAGQDAADARLMRLLLTFAHVALAVEVQREDEGVHRGLRASLPIRRAPADIQIVGSDNHA